MLDDYMLVRIKSSHSCLGKNEQKTEFGGYETKTAKIRMVENKREPSRIRVQTFKGKTVLMERKSGNE